MEEKDTGHKSVDVQLQGHGGNTRSNVRCYPGSPIIISRRRMPQKIYSILADCLRNAAESLEAKSRVAHKARRPSLRGASESSQRTHGSTKQRYKCKK